MRADTLTRTFAAFTSTGTATAPGLLAAAGARLLALLRELRRRRREHRAMERALDELALMDEHRLHDIGLSPSDVRSLRLRRTRLQPPPAGSAEQHALLGRPPLPRHVDWR